MPDQCVQFGDRVRDFGADTTVRLFRQCDFRDDALGGKMLEERLTALEPRQMSAQSRQDAHATLGDVAPELRPERLGTRRPEHVPRGPRVVGRVIGVARQGLAFAG